MAARPSAVSAFVEPSLEAAGMPLNAGTEDTLIPLSDIVFRDTLMPAVVLDHGDIFSLEVGESSFKEVHHFHIIGRHAVPHKDNGSC